MMIISDWLHFVFGRARLLPPGIPAPDFVLPDQENRMVRLSDFRGQRVVLWFYVKADTPGWAKEGSEFRNQIGKFRKAGVQVVGISFDSPPANAVFAKRYQFPFLLLSDQSRDTGVAYGACISKNAPAAKRITYLIDAQGKVEMAWARLKPAEHASAVIEHLQSKT